MSRRFGKVPKEVPANRDVKVLAPAVQRALARVLARMAEEGHKAIQFDTLRTAERQAFLFGFGRDYDDGRGVVTKVEDHLASWHGYGLAVDVVEDDKDPWVASQAFWNDLGRIAREEGFDWGGDWPMKDLPHLQWGKCRRSPSAKARALLKQGGAAAVWKEVGAL